jgi:anti-anti-sigma regulatory factor
LLKLSTSDYAENEIVLHLEGDVTDPGSGELKRVVTTLLSEGKHVVLELSAVRFIDAQGVEMLHRWRQSVALTNCTPFVNEVLKARIAQHE